MTYKEFIEIKQWNQPSEDYQKHHIIPVCKGGTNDESNLIRLSYLDHYIAHKLLAEENPGDKQLQSGFNFMGHSIENYLKKCDSLTESRPDKYTDEVRAKMKKSKVYHSEDARYKHRLLQCINHKGPNDKEWNNMTLEEKIARFEANELKRQIKQQVAEQKREWNKHQKQIQLELDKLEAERSELEAKLKDAKFGQKTRIKEEIKTLISKKQELNANKRISFADWLIKYANNA